MLIDTIPHDIRKEIEQQFEYYITRVSAKGHAGSLEVSLYLYGYCMEHQPKRIIDLGSGFTSYVLRLYTKHNENVTVYSVDDNKDWLNKTIQFLNRTKVSTDNLIHLFELSNEINNTFDLVFYDMGKIPTRIQYIDLPFDLVSHQGVIIMDDAHWGETMGLHMNPTLRDTMEVAIKRHGFKYISLKEETIDEYGRYSLLVKKHDQ